MTVTNIRDNRQLHVLNREERRGYQKLYQGEPTMTVKLETQIEVVNYDGQPYRLMDKDETGPKLKDVLVYALRVPIQPDNGTSFEKKFQRSTMVKRLLAGPEIDLAATEIQFLKDRVGFVFHQIDLIGRVVELLDRVTVS